MRLTSTLHPWASISKSGRVRSHERGRVCAHSACSTILSIYNPTRFCSLHAHSATLDRRHRAQELAVREATCAHCGTAFETLNQARRFCSDRCRMAAFARRKRAASRSKLGTAP
jgi:protein-arginine kinase activator protein McsA